MSGPIREVLDGGRRRRRRRRWGTGLAGLAAAAVVATLALLLADVVPGSPDPGVAPLPRADLDRPSSARSLDSPGEDGDPGRPDLVRIDRRGRLDPTTGARVVDRIENPLGVRPPRYSWAAAVRLDGEVSWWLLESAPVSRSVSVDSSSSRLRTLDAWTAHELGSRAAGTDGSPDVSRLVRFDRDSTRLAARSGVELLEQRTVVGVGGALAAPEDTTAVAEVRWRGRRWYVLALRAPSGQTAYLPFVAAGRAADLDAFLELARAETISGVAP